MEWPSTDILLILIAVGFVAAFIDSVVGGGGLVALPALLLTGLPPALALGTNKLGGTLSSMTSTLSFLWSGKINVRLVLALFPLSFIGSALGTYTVQLLPPDFLRPLVVVLLIAVLIYSLPRTNAIRRLSGALRLPGSRAASPSVRPEAFNKQRDRPGEAAALSGWRKPAAAGCALALGYYDGFFGPGTGSFLLFFFLLLGFDFVSASGNAKVLNFASNLASLAAFFWFKSVHLGYGLPMGLSMIAGAVAGSQFAIRQGSRFVKPMFVVVTTLLIGKQLWDLLT